MTYLLDTNTCVHCLRTRGNPLVPARLGTHPPGDVALCSVVVGELRHGAEGSTNPAKEHAKVDAFAPGSPASRSTTRRPRSTAGSATPSKPPAR